MGSRRFLLIGLEMGLVDEEGFEERRVLEMLLYDGKIFVV